MRDPTGRLITLIRDNAGVAAITPRVSSRRRSGWVPPFVIVRVAVTNPWIGDPGSETAGVRTWRYFIQCYGQRVENGDELAYDLAGAVSDAVNNMGLLTFPVSGGRAAIYRIQEDGIGPPLTDATSQEPYVVLTLTVLASAQVLAA